MKKDLLTRSQYSFDPANKKIYFSSPVNLGHIGVITNVTAQTVIYLFSDTDTGGTFSSNTLTLYFDTTLMSRTDELQILLYVPEEADPNMKAVVGLLQELLTEMKGFREQLQNIR